jgi:hypothetical protein
VEAPHWDNRKFPGHEYALSPEEKRASLERETLNRLRYLIEEKGLVVDAAPILQSDKNPRKPLDIWFRDIYQHDYLLEEKNIWYYPLDPLDNCVDLSEARFYLQSKGWLKTDVFSRSWSEPRFYIRRLLKTVNGRRFYDHVDLDPSEVRRVYVSTIASFNSIETELALMNFFQYRTIFLMHPMPDVNSPLQKELSYHGGTDSCVGDTIVRLHDALEAIIEDDGP